MRIRALPSTLLALLLLFLGAGCSSYSSLAVRTAPWPKDPPQQLRSVIVGIFTGGAPYDDRQDRATMQLAALLAFALQERGFLVIEQIETVRLLSRMGLSARHLLTGDEILRISGRHRARLYLQGKIAEQTTTKLLEEETQVAAALYIHDAWRGEKLATIKAFGDDLEQYDEGQSLQLARLLANCLDELLDELIEERSPWPEYSEGFSLRL